MRKLAYGLSNNEGTDPRNLISASLFLSLGRMVSLVSIAKVSSLKLASVAGQADLRLSTLESPKTDSLVTMLIMSLTLAHFSEKKV